MRTTTLFLFVATASIKLLVSAQSSSDYPQCPVSFFPAIQPQPNRPQTNPNISARKQICKASSAFALTDPNSLTQLCGVDFRVAVSICEAAVCTASDTAGKSDSKLSYHLNEVPASYAIANAPTIDLLSRHLMLRDLSR